MTNIQILYVILAVLLTMYLGVFVLSKLVLRDYFRRKVEFLRKVSNIDDSSNEGDQ